MIFLPSAIISPVTPDISIGGINAYAETEELRGFGLLLSVAIEFCDEDRQDQLVYDFPPTGQVVHLGRLEDTGGRRHHAQIPEVERCVALVDAARARGERVLVTCAMGRNRSALVIAEHLIRTGMSPDDAVRLLQSARRWALTNDDFVTWLLRER